MYSPESIESFVNTECGIIGVEYDFVLNDIIGRVPWVEISTNAIEYPHWRRTFLAINHPTAICIGVTPVCSRDVLDTVRNAVPIGIDWVLIIARVVLWVGAIQILLAIPNTTCICIGIHVIRHICVSTTVANDSGDEIQ